MRWRVRAFCSALEDFLDELTALSYYDRHMNTTTNRSPSSTEAPIKLQPPGAGLPLSQRLVIKFWLGPVVSKRATLAESRANYEGLTRKIIEKVAGVPPVKRTVKVLVKPLVGLEDSSRFWSLNDVLEHLTIVSTAIEAGILSLASGVVPDTKADTAKVKPKGADHDLLAEYTAFGPVLLARLDEKLAKPGLDINSPLTHRHPWFGPFTARQWYWLLGGHQGVHYQQVKEIIKGL
jgi:hypothetical protein